MIIIVIGWIGNVLLLAGAWLLVKKRSAGFWCYIFGSLAYLLVGVFTPMPSLIFLNAVFLVINIYGVVKWRQK